MANGVWKVVNPFVFGRSRQLSLNKFLDTSTRGVQISKKLDSELALYVFPLDSMSGVTTEKFSLLA